MSWLLAVLLASAPVELRREPRVHAGISFAGGAAYSPRTNGFGAGGGPSAELGVVLSDRYSLMVRTTVVTSIFFFALHLGFAFDVALTDQWRFGLGVALATAFGFEASSFSAIAVVGRVTFAPFGRSEEDVARRGLALFIEVTPGIDPTNARRAFAGAAADAFPPLSIGAFAGIGYAWW